MKLLKLEDETFAIVDDEDFERLSKFSWRVTGKCKTTFSRWGGTEITILGDKRDFRVTLSQEIMGRRVLFDHINRDARDNRKCNLREATPEQNSQNRRKWYGTSSKYKGVCWVKIRRKWRVSIRANNKKYFLGEFENELDAAKAYNIAALQHHKEFAVLNKIDSEIISAVN